MRSVIASLLVVVCAAMCVAPSFAADPCRLYVVRETGDDVSVDVVTLADGETRVFVVGPGSDVIEVVWPLSPGKSGNLVRRGDGGYALVVTYADGRLSLRSKQPDGSERALPSIQPADVCGYNLRVNVVGGDGVKKAFRVSRCGEPAVDNGPVFDIFGGKLPISPGDYSVTIETTLARQLEQIAGSAPLRLHDGTLFCRVSVGGRDGNFIVDTAAGGTLVRESFLPANTEITRLKAIAYSSDGTEERDGVMQGAGGEVDNFLGAASVPELTLGSMRFEDVDLSVVAEMPDYGDVEVDGIVGLDLLQRAEAATIVYPDGAGENGELVLHAAGEGPSVDGHEIPFVLADKHVFVEGTLNGAPARFLVDSGARGSFVPPALFAAAGLASQPGESKTFRGLDGNTFSATVTRVQALALGGVDLGAADFFAGDLAVLKNWGIDEDTALFGNDLLTGLGRVSLDFHDNTMRFGRRGN
jgi:hypothetical protein